MRAKRNFVVVVYDITDDRRRGHVVKVLEKVGIRVNYSVFECLLTDAQYHKLQNEILSKISTKEDRIIYYPICVECYSKIINQPFLRKKYEKVNAV